MLYDVIIIGMGPAGIGAALYTTRAKLSTLIIGREDGALTKSDKIENYYGFAEPVSGKALLEQGIAQAKRLGATLVFDEVTEVSYVDNYEIETPHGKYQAKTLLLATGASRTLPPIPKLAEYEGKGLSYCATCDGFFYRGKTVAVLGAGAYALAEAQALLPLASKVYLLTNGQAVPQGLPANLEVKPLKIKAIQGASRLEGVIFEDGSSLALAGLFVAYGVAGSFEIARKVGIELENNHIKVDSHMQTNVPHLYAAGDCTGGVLQINKAIHDGCEAATSIIKDVRNNK